MGSICDSRNTNRAVALLRRLGGGPEVAELKGQSVEILDVGLEAQLHSISGWMRVRLPDGRERTFELGQLHEVTDCGVAGYALEDLYDEDQLRVAIEAELADPDSALDEDGREGLRRGQPPPALPDGDWSPTLHRSLRMSQGGTYYGCDSGSRIRRCSGQGPVPVVCGAPRSPHEQPLAAAFAEAGPVRRPGG